jgi:hypothetical protein
METPLLLAAALFYHFSTARVEMSAAVFTGSQLQERCPDQRSIHRNG